MFEEIYENVIEGQEKKAGKHDVYSKFARARKCEAALTASQAEVSRLKARVALLESSQGLSGERGGRGGKGMTGVRGTGPRGRGRGSGSGWEEDDAFVAARALVCMQWNRDLACRSTPCTLQHSCNKKVLWGQICQERHKENNH